MREILVPVFRRGECVYESPSVMEIADYCRREKDTLWDETKRLFYPHQVYVDLSDSLYKVKKSCWTRWIWTDFAYIRRIVFMNIIVLAGGCSSERDVSLSSGGSICRALRERGHNAYLLDSFLGLPDAPEHLEDVFTLPGGGLEIATGIQVAEPDLQALWRRGRGIPAASSAPT